MRQIVLDTETTGLEPKDGHKIIEIGCVEIINRRSTGDNFHEYINPERDIDDGAYDVHGISNEFLKDKPLFKDIAQKFIDYVRGSELIIHNAPFDVGFINHELKKLGKNWGKLEDYCTIEDTLKRAREKHPGQKNSLDALCKRYEVDNSQRDLHGALLDAQILLDVYLAMTREQGDLVLDDTLQADNQQQTELNKQNKPRPPIKIIKATAEETAAHEKRLEQIREISGGKCIWIDKGY